MVTKLPSTSGPLPDGESPGCDTADIYQIHRIFRWMYGELPSLIRGVPDGDIDRAAIVADFTAAGFIGLHMHHETEDLVLWDRMVDRAPGCVAHVDQMRAQHAEIAAQLAVVEPLLASWRATAQPDLRDHLAEQVERLRDTLGAHLGQEEADAIPVAGEVLTQAEWDEMGEHARHGLQERKAELPKDFMAVQFGFMLASVPSDERDAWFKANVPAPIRLLYALILKRKYERSMKELYPDRPVPSMV